LSVTAVLVGHDDQFQKGDFGELDFVIFRLSHSTVWTKVPLLADDFSKAILRAPRPSENELLSPCVFEILENQLDASEGLPVVENKPDNLASRSGCAPTRFVAGQRRLNWIAALF